MQNCQERLGLAVRTVEQRARLEHRLWQSPALRAARDAGVSYERLRILSRLPEREIERWIPRARGLTCVALGEAVETRQETQMRAARVPARVAELLRAAFRRGVHGGYQRVRGRAPDALVWDLLVAPGSWAPFRAGAAPAPEVNPRTAAAA